MCGINKTDFKEYNKEKNNFWHKDKKFNKDWKIRIKGIETISWKLNYIL